MSTGIGAIFGKWPFSIRNPNSQYQDGYSKKIIESYENHPRVVTMKENVLPDSMRFDLPPASKEDINKISRSVQTKQQGLMEYCLNIFSFLPMLLANILLVL